MSHKKHQIWVMMPVLGLLLMSPKDIQSKYGRHIASGEPVPAQEVSTSVEAESKTPKLDALLSGVEIPVKHNPLNLNSDMLKEDITSLLSRVSKAEEFDKTKVEKPQLDKLREEIKVSAIELKQVENSIKDLMNPEDISDVPSRITEAKIRLEASLKDLESTEALVAARPAPVVAPAETPVVTTTPSTQTTPAQRAPSVVQEETTVSSEGKKEEKDPILCALEEQNKLLQQTLQTFVQQQTTIMQQMMQMSQMMVMQNMYRTPDTFNYNQAYQYYQQPMVAGNWVYYPQGQNPLAPMQPQGQSNIFGMQPPQQMQPQMQQPQMNYSFNPPEMMNQGQGQWGLQPSSPFIHPQGNFGMDSVGSAGSMGSGFSPVPIPQTTGAPVGSVPPMTII
jgi:hypothetical protein